MTGLALEAWERARQTLKAQGVELNEVILHHNQDPVFTSYAWTSHLLLSDGVTVSYDRNAARDNPQMESLIDRLETENRSFLLDTQTLEELQAVMRESMDYHNSRRRDSTIGYQVPPVRVAGLLPWP